MIRALPKRPGKPFEKIFTKASPEAIDLLKRLLTFDFKKRITVEEALAHEYLSELHFPEDEVSLLLLFIDYISLNIYNNIAY